MLDYVYGQDEIVAPFVAQLIPHCRRGFGPNVKTIGVIDSEGWLIAGFVFHNFEPETHIIEISGAALPNKKWCTQRTLAHIYQYPFLQLGCQMIVQRVQASNERLLRQLAALNYAFVRVPRLFGRNEDCVICLLTEEDWAANKICQRFKHHLVVEDRVERAA